MQTLIILTESLIIGTLVGFAAGIGVARMANVPTVQALGAFRTLGEMNSGENNATSHFSFGLSFFFSSLASAIAAGSFTQDITHRVISNWAAAILMIKNQDEQELHNPKKMGIAGAIVGALVVSILNLTSSALPQVLKTTATRVLVPAAVMLVDTVMPVVFWLAAIDGGKRSGVFGSILGGLAQIIMGNAVPGIVLGIIVGKGVDESGWNKTTKAIFIATIVVLTLIAFLKGIDLAMLKQLNLSSPTWLEQIHTYIGK